MGFVLAILPLLIILVGITLLKQSGLRMAFVGWIASVILAVAYFHTSAQVAIAASAMGFIKALGISVAVVVTMYMIFLMGQVGALSVISDRIKRVVRGSADQALYIGIGFGSFLTSLGVVTPALFPPLLLVMGFTPVAAVAIAVLGYNATTSFALLAIPITLPAGLFGFDPVELAFKVSLFLPVISVGLAFAVLWLIGGREAMRKGWIPATIVGLAVALSALLFTGIDYFTGTEYIPIRVVGAFAGLIAMGALQLYQRLKPPTEEEPADATAAPEGAGNDASMSFAAALSPWIILTVLAVIISVPRITTWLKDLPGDIEVLTIWDQKVDLDIMSQIYTWIFVALLLSLPILKPTREQLGSTTRTWAKRSWGPFLAYSIYFCIAFVMAWSAQEVVNGALVPTDFYQDYNMNVIVGSTLAAVFGVGYIFVAAALGLFGAVVGGSETSSNVMFHDIQHQACTDIGLTNNEFLTVYSAHAVAGGVASAITPAKLNNAAATIDAGPEVESIVMRKHITLAILLTIATGLLTGLFVGLGW
jgi:lactate permease